MPLYCTPEAQSNPVLRSRCKCFFSQELFKIHSACWIPKMVYVPWKIVDCKSGQNLQA